MACSGDRTKAAESLRQAEILALPATSCVIPLSLVASLSLKLILC